MWNDPALTADEYQPAPWYIGVILVCAIIASFPAVRAPVFVPLVGYAVVCGYVLYRTWLAVVWPFCRIVYAVTRASWEMLHEDIQ